MASSLAPPAQDQPAPSPRLSVELPDSQAPTLTPPTAHSSPRHERATLPPEPADGAPTASAAAPAPPAPNPTDVAITFLLISGARQTLHLAPSTTVGRAKEAFWGAWTPENTADKPPAPSFLRVLHMGKILSDDQTLTAAKFPDVSTNPAGTIVHISIRPFGPLADEDIVKAKRRSRFLSTTNSSSVRPAPGTVSNDPEVSHAAGCCGCVIC